MSLASSSDKTALRRYFRRARAGVAQSARKQAELCINRSLCALLKRGKKIGLYWAVGSEVRLSSLLHTALRRGAAVYLPYIEPGRRRLWFTAYTARSAAERQRRGRLNIPQFAGQKIRADRLSCLLVPLVAIDRSGYRLGQGGGFYDASLAQLRFRRPLTVGVGFACQTVEQLPHEPHDRPLHRFVCEAGMVRFGRYPVLPRQPLFMPYTATAPDAAAT